MLLGFDVLQLSKIFALGFLSIALLAAAILDFVYYQIPNRLVIITLLLSSFFIVILKNDIWLANLTLAVIFVVCGTIFYALQWIGYGDVKLFGVIAFWLGFIPFLKLMIYTSVCGGILSLLYLSFPKIVYRLRIKVENLYITRRLVQLFAPLNDDLTVDQEESRKALPYAVPLAISWFCLVHFFYLN